MSPTDSASARTDGSGGAGAVWLRNEHARPSRTPPLSRERIVAGAVALLDEHGADRLTMRRLAARLDVTSTALYWHVRTKDDVLDLAFDRIFAEVAVPDSVGAWHDDVRTLVGQWRDAMLRHPWSPALVGRPMLGPNVLARTEFLQSALSRGGFSGLRLAVATRAVADFVIGAALTQSTWHQAGPPIARTEARRHIAANRGTYPTLEASGHLDDQRWNDDELFDRGLSALLVGLGGTAEGG